jgi:thiamine kinase-like enzyme
MTGEIEQARAALARLPQFQDVDRDATVIERLGGLTNLVFRVDAGGESYCLRIAGQGTEDYIDRKVEAHNAQVAARAGVSAEVLFFDPADGLMLARFLDGTTTMTPKGFLATPGAPGRAARAFRQLHDCGEAFQFRFELFAMIDDYLGILAKRGAQLPEGYHDVVTEAQAVRRALDAHPAKLAPCHCDPLCENFLDDGRRMWIVDWEYSGMNDPIWDLGDLSVEAGFGEAEDLRRGGASGGPRPDGHLQGHVRLAVDPLGPDPARRQQPRRRLLGLFGQPLRALQGADGPGRLRHLAGSGQRGPRLIMRATGFDQSPARR